MKMFKKTRKAITPAILATMMLSPSILLDEAHARDRNRDGDRTERNRDRGDRNRDRGENRNDNRNDRRNNDNWERQYVGKLSFKLEDDPELAAKVRVAKNLSKQLDTDKKAFDAKKTVLDAAEKAQGEVLKKIEAANKTILKSASKKTDLEAALPGMNTQLGTLKTELDLAQAAFDSVSGPLKKLNKKKKEIEKAEQQCTATPSAECTAKLEKLKGQLPKLQAAYDAKKGLIDAANTKLEAAKKAHKGQEKKIAKAKKDIVDLGKAISTASAEKKKQQGQLVIENAKVSQAKSALAPVQKKYEETNRKHTAAVKSRDDEKDMLITRILRMNALGADEGRISGVVDGGRYAKFLGIREGQLDGDRDGESEGIREGRARATARGEAQGEIDGTNSANTRGQEVGERLGTDDGNRIAGQREGKAQGISDAENSNAATVGQGQGREAGLDRAIRTGKTRGTAQGESEAINNFENRGLKTGSAEGTFAGAFAPRIPNYPGFNCVERRGRRYMGDDYGWRRHGDYRVDLELCPNFVPRHPKLRRVKRLVLKKAFVNAYLKTYRRARRQEFVQAIDNVYLGVYNSSRSAAFEDFSSRDYPEVVESARANEAERVFNIKFPIVRDRVRAEFRRDVSASPDRQSAIFTSNYASAKKEHYARVYEEIRSANFGIAENATFNDNIEAQTAKYKKIRLGEVTQIYKSNPVLKYVSSQITDGGISGVAAKDGVFQPGETTYHSITVKNFGEKAATNAKVVMENGTSVKLPTIAAGSTVTIKGAAKGMVPNGSRIGSTHRSILRVYSNTTAEAKIQGRHYYNASQGLLNGGDQKNLRVAFPMSLSGLRTSQELLINKQNALNLSVSNKSKRAYKGPLKITLSGNTNIVKKGFNSLNNLSGTVNLNDAQLLVTSEDDVFKPLTLRATISKKGVKLGELDMALSTMAKAPYAEKAGAPVIVVDSERSARDLISLLGSFGGLKKASVLDLSLSRLNAGKLGKGLNSQVGLILDNGRGSTHKGLAALLANSKDSAMVFIDDNGTVDLDNAKRTAAMKDSFTMPVMFGSLPKNIQMTFSSKKSANLKDTTMILTTPSRNAVRMAKAAQELTMSETAMFNAMNGINKSNFAKGSKAVKLANLKAMGEVMALDEAYRNSRRDDRFADAAESGSDLLFQKVYNKAGDKFDKKKLGLQLAAYSMGKSLNSAMDEFSPVAKPLTMRIENDVQAKIKNSLGCTTFICKKRILKGLKKKDKGLYKLMEKNKLVNHPFDNKGFANDNGFDDEDDWR